MQFPSSVRGLRRLAKKYNSIFTKGCAYRVGQNICPLGLICETNNVDYMRIKKHAMWLELYPNLNTMKLKLAGIEYGFEGYKKAEFDSKELFDNPVFKRYYQVGKRLYEATHE